MIFQYSIAGFEWVIGFGLMFGLAIAFTLLVKKRLALEIFFVFLFMFNALIVMAGLLEVWTLIVNLILLVVMLYMFNRPEKTK